MLCGSRAEVVSRKFLFPDSVELVLSGSGSMFYNFYKLLPYGRCLVYISSIRSFIIFWFMADVYFTYFPGFCFVTRLLAFVLFLVTICCLHVPLFVFTLTCLKQGSKFIFGFGSTCATRCKFLGALPKF